LAGGDTFRREGAIVVEVTFTLQLPSEALSVPIARRVLSSAMRTLGLSEVCLTDIETALTEACTNVLDHAVDGQEYTVIAGFTDETCVIEVVDTGRGFDAEQVGHAEADPSSERGRGIQLIRALVDRVRFDARPENGMVVHLEKQLAFVDGSALQRLTYHGTDAAALGSRNAAAALRDRHDLLDC
jgi:serine/threonine-protein kinase RsbW